MNVLGWREMIELSPVYADIKNWPPINISSLNERRKRFIRNRNIVGAVLSGKKINAVSYEYKVSAAFVSYLLKRCLSAQAHEEPNLTTGLIPHARVRKGKRKAHLSVNNSSGTRGSFQYILRHNIEIKLQLDKVLKAYVKGSLYSQNLSPKSFHQEFLRLLSERNWPTNQYPFDQERLGYESCRKYFHKQINKLKLPKPVDNQELVVKKFPKRCYEVAELDSQLIDIFCNVVIEVNGNKSTVRMSRMALFVVVDVASNCILSYHLSFTKDPNQYDLLTLLKNIHHKWEPRNLTTPGLSYEPGACLPSAISEEYRNLGIGILKLDNALCHHANSIRDYVCDGMISTLNFGLPATPRSRNTIEYLFNKLNKYLHRFKSTTGSHHKDPNKEPTKLNKKPPLLNLKNLEDFLSVILTGHNVKPQNRLGGLTPLEVLKNNIIDYPLQLNFSKNKSFNNPFKVCKTVNVCGNLTTSNMPVISFSGLKYKGNGLLNADLINKKILIHLDTRDIRHVEAFTLDGKSLGILRAPKSWQNYPLSLTTFKFIKKKVKRKNMLAGDCQGEYFNSLLKQKHMPKVATEIVRVSREFSQGLVQLNHSNKRVEQKPKVPLALSNQNIEKWRPGIFNDEGGES